MDRRVRWILFTGYIFNACMIAFAGFFAAAMVSIFLRAYFAVELLGWLTAGSLAVAGVAGMVRLVVGIFMSSQIRLQELMLTLFAAACVATPFANRVREATQADPDHALEQMLGLPMSVIVFFFLGSAWGWNAASRLNESRPFPRIILLFKGWMLCGGAIGALGVSLVALFVLVEGRMVGDVGALLYTCLPVSLLMIPSLLVERQCRRRNLTQSRKDAMNPSQQ